MIDPRESTPAGGVEKPARPSKNRVRQVLLVDPSPALVPVLERATPEHGRTVVVYAADLAAAHDALKSAGAIDLLVAAPDLPDGLGVDLARELTYKDPAISAVLVCNGGDFSLARQAMRAGVTDIICRPTGSDDEAASAMLLDRVRDALDKQWVQRERMARVRRLKRLCRRLNDARLEVSEQVDVLCNDLVTAYQELAVQMQNLTQVNGYQQVVEGELDLEAVLRKTLEYLVQQAGPCNAAIFLPSTVDEYALGGYVNYDCTKESADLLLEHLADVLAPRVGTGDDVFVHVTDNQGLTDLLGDDWNYLADCHLVALPCRQDDESLAVIALFRDDSEPFTEPALDAISSVAELMGRVLSKIIRVHHRSLPDIDDPPIDSSNGTYLPPSEWDGYNQQADPFDDEDDDAMPF